MSFNDTVYSIYTKFEDELLKPNKEYNNKKEEYIKLRNKFENEVNLNQEQIELIDNICDKLVEMEEVLYIQIFRKSFKIAKDLYKS